MNQHQQHIKNKISALTIEEWSKVVPGIDSLLDDLVNHARNTAFDETLFDENDSADFRRHCAISLRQFLVNK